MQPRLTYRRQNPLAQILTATVAAVGLGLALFLGAFILAAIIGLGAIAAAGLYLRFWWLRRRLQGRGPQPHRPAGSRDARSRSAAGTVIEGDYRDLGEQAPRRAWEQS